MSRLRDRLRFGFVLFHLTAVTVLSVPAPVGARMDATWKERHVRSQVLEWVAPFRSLLGDRSDEQVLTLTRAVATRILNVRDLVIAPFVPYARTVGAGQGWQMFGSLNDQPARLRIRVAPGALRHARRSRATSSPAPPERTALTAESPMSLYTASRVPAP